MLKDLIKNISKNNEKIVNSIADGYVDIKVYKKNNKEGEKKLIYHDTGDNTVTNWMRQIILQLLTGYSLSQSGNSQYSWEADEQNGKSISINTTSSGSSFSLNESLSTINSEYHGSDKNLDGITFGVEDAKYFFEPSLYKFKFVQYDFNDDNKVNEDDAEETKYMYPVFPTKVLLGTGKEYVNWETLKAENEFSNRDWFSEKISWYGNSEEEAKNQIDKLISETPNRYSATVNMQGVYNGKGTITPAITVDDPDSSSLYDSPSDLASRYGVVGAIKTLYLKSGEEDGYEVKFEDNTSVTDLLNPVLTDDGKLLRTKYRGVGMPCFIYFNRVYSEGLDWGKTASAGVSLSKDSGNDYKNRINFRIVLPSQSSDEYYPYNGFTLKQIGLFNDSILENSDNSETTIGANNMPFGTMLAVKNISPFRKTADEEVVFTWSLTI